MVAEIVDERLWRAKALREEHQYEQALALILEVLDDDPENPQALFQAGGLFILLDKKGLAHNLMARCLKFAPDSPEAWINYGRTLADTPEGWEESEQCFFRALEMNPQSRAAYENLGALELGRCNPAKSIAYCLKALELDAQSRVAISTLGFAQLMDGDWQNGWKNYHTMLGHRSRPLIQYGDLPEWDGSPGKSVIVNGEQGIGDEILYASMIADMAKDCRYVIYDGMERLNGLMCRSLPDNVIVAGSRWKDELELPAEIAPDAQITQAGVGMFYRTSDESFPGTPYLRADPTQRLAMRSVLDSFGPHPKVGIAWTGGTKFSRRHFRQRTLEWLTPLLRVQGVHWISLEYHDRSAEIAAYARQRRISVENLHWITGLKEYDQTAALVAELDLVIAVPTSVTQLAGALGTPAWVMVPETTGWLFSHEPYVWASCVRLFRNRPVKDVAQAFQTWLNAYRRQAA